MSFPVFIGRKNELERLKALKKKGKPSLVVVKGRRRVGKSRLINFFASNYNESRLWDFVGLAPQDGLSDQNQRDHFARRLASILGLPSFTFQDWTDAFEYLSKHLKAGDIVYVLKKLWHYRLATSLRLKDLEMAKQ